MSYLSETLYLSHAPKRLARRKWLVGIALILIVLDIILSFFYPKLIFTIFILVIGSGYLMKSLKPIVIYLKVKEDGLHLYQKNSRLFIAHKNLRLGNTNENIFLQWSQTSIAHTFYRLKLSYKEALHLIWLCNFNGLTLKVSTIVEKKLNQVTSDKGVFRYIDL